MSNAFNVIRQLTKCRANCGLIVEWFRILQPKNMIRFAQWELTLPLITTLRMQAEIRNNPISSSFQFISEILLARRSEFTQRFYHLRNLSYSYLAGNGFVDDSERITNSRRRRMVLLDL